MTSDTHLPPPLDDPRIEAFGMLIEAHNELIGVLHPRLGAATDVPLPWLSVLIRLWRSPDHRLRMTELACDMTMSTSGLTRLIDRIEDAGYVRREPCPSDRRGLLAVLTDEGIHVLAAVAPGHLADLDTYLTSALEPGELAMLTELLRKVRNHIRERG